MDRRKRRKLRRQGKWILTRKDHHTVYDFRHTMFKLGLDEADESGTITHSGLDKVGNYWTWNYRSR